MLVAELAPLDHVHRVLPRPDVGGDHPDVGRVVDALLAQLAHAPDLGAEGDLAVVRQVLQGVDRGAVGVDKVDAVFPLGPLLGPAGAQGGPVARVGRGVAPVERAELLHAPEHVRRVHVVLGHERQGAQQVDHRDEVDDVGVGLALLQRRPLGLDVDVGRQVEQGVAGPPVLEPPGEQRHRVDPERVGVVDDRAGDGVAGHLVHLDPPDRAERAGVQPRPSASPSGPLIASSCLTTPSTPGLSL